MVDNVMIFPDTWEEFEKQYGFYDSKQVYMYGNTRLIPSFRVQQWLNHLDDINCKKQSQKNKMEQIAKMFGKKLGEKFKIYRVAWRDRREIIHGKFTERGLLTTCCLALEDDYNFDRNDLIMRQLLTGKAEIVKEQVCNE